MIRVIDKLVFTACFLCKRCFAVDTPTPESSRDFRIFPLKINRCVGAGIQHNLAKWSNNQAHTYQRTLLLVLHAHMFSVSTDHTRICALPTGPPDRALEIWHKRVASKALQEPPVQSDVFQIHICITSRRCFFFPITENMNPRLKVFS